MNIKKYLLLLLLLPCLSVFSQETCNCPGGGQKSNGTFYASWGYNKDWYSKSDLHFYNSNSDNYDFVLYDVGAKDRPGFEHILTSFEVTVPQYSFRVGYYLNNKHDIGIELNFDHSKYVMTEGENVHVEGQIHGVELDKDTILYNHFLKFEHTNGANFLMANFIKRKNFLHSADNKHWLSLVLKPGAGIVIPKTDVTLFDTHIDNKFHIAGWIAGIETGLRYDFRHFFTEATAKGTFANYTNVLSCGTGRANHHFWCAELILTAGFQLGF